MLYTCKSHLFRSGSFAINRVMGGLARLCHQILLSSLCQRDMVDSLLDHFFPKASLCVLQIDAAQHHDTSATGHCIELT